MVLKSQNKLPLLYNKDAEAHCDTSRFTVNKFESDSLPLGKIDKLVQEL